MKNTVLFIALSFLGVLFFSAYSNGLATPPNGQNRTGAGGSQPDCSGSGCHSANNNNLTVSIIPVDLVSGDTVNSYTPNTPYKMRIWAINSSGGNYPSYGYQFAAQQQNGNGAGTYFNTPGLHAIPISTFEIIEPFQPKNTFLGKCVDSVNWISPPKNSGVVTLFATVLFANNDGFATGDLANNLSRTMTEKPTGIDDANIENQIVLCPNYGHEKLKLIISHATNKTYQSLIIDQFGKIVSQENFNVNQSNWCNEIDLNGFAPGNYVLYLNNGNQQKSLKFMVY